MMNKYPQNMKIGLLTPYTGGNLGDGAIQEAVIADIRARYRDVYIYGFTLCPEETEKIHKIPCYPLTALAIRHYCSAPPARKSEALVQERRSADSFQRVKDMIKRITPLFRALKLIHRWGKALSYLPAEARLIKDSYRMLKEFDLLIVSGGGQLDDYWGGPWGHPYSLLKWGLIARATTTRYVFLSVGTCTLESRLSVLFVKWALKLAAYRSYRDERSKTLLKQMPFTRNDAVCPDLAFGHELPAFERTLANPERRPVVGISPIAYLSSYSWPKENLDTYNRYMSTLIAFVSSLLRDGYFLVLFHTDGSDKLAVKELREALEMETGYVGSIVEVAMGTVEVHLSLMAQLDCVVASRLHGVILAHLMNRPVLAIAYDRKVTTHMGDLGQADYCLDIHDFDLDSLTKAFGDLKSNQEVIRSQISEKATQFKSALTAQYDEILYTCSDRTTPPVQEIT